MNTNLTHLIEAFAGLDILVIGDVMLDSYLHGAANGLCREAPVPIVALSDRIDAPGGAANTAANVQSLGARVTLLSVAGADAERGLLCDALAARGVATEHLLSQPSRRTLAKHRVIAAAQILVRFDQGSTGMIHRATEQRLIDRLIDCFPRCDALIVSDYGYGILTPRVIATLADLQARTPRVVVVDSKRLAAYRHGGITAAKPNYAEAVRLLGLRELDDPPARLQQIAAHEEQLLGITGAQIVAVTLDTEGALIVEHGSPSYRTYARPTAHSRAAGAGDTFMSAFTLALAAGAHTPAAAELASAAAAIVVAKDGTAVCSADELCAYISAEDQKIADLPRLVARLEGYRQHGRRIVLTNGCFDILHRGHITYLNRAKALGDILIVGLNTDSSIHRLKGPTRPINSLEDRAQVLAALSSVDHIVAFDEDTPVELVRAIRPDVFVKGGDYTRDRLPEAAVVEALGGTVEILPYLDDHSTTGIIERIQAAYRMPQLGAERLQERALGTN